MKQQQAIYKWNREDAVSWSSLVDWHSESLFSDIRATENELRSRVLEWPRRRPACILLVDHLFRPDDVKTLTRLTDSNTKDSVVVATQVQGEHAKSLMATATRVVIAAPFSVKIDSDKPALYLLLREMKYLPCDYVYGGLTAIFAARTRVTLSDSIRSMADCLGRNGVLILTTWSDQVLTKPIVAPLAEELKVRDDSWQIGIRNASRWEALEVDGTTITLRWDNGEEYNEDAPEMPERVAEPLVTYFVDFVTLKTVAHRYGLVHRKSLIPWNMGATMRHQELLGLFVCHAFVKVTTTATETDTTAAAAADRPYTKRNRSPDRETAAPAPVVTADRKKNRALQHSSRFHRK